MVTLEQLNAALFLKEFKILIEKDRIWVVQRDKNLTPLGLNNTQCIQELLDLSVENYVAGPKKDRDRPGVIWEFGKMIGDTEVYIKLKIADDGAEKHAVCISFHPAEWPMNYPFVM
ncbi:MAG: hypothetical protein V1816_00780 [Pseudomonadota bacterium]